MEIREIIQNKEFYTILNLCSHTQLRQLAGFVGDLKHFADCLIYLRRTHVQLVNKF